MYQQDLRLASLPFSPAPFVLSEARKTAILIDPIDAPSAISRLIDLGVPAYLIQSTLLGVMAQRLIRTICPHCKTLVDLLEQSIG